MAKKRKQVGKKNSSAKKKNGTVKKVVVKKPIKSTTKKSIAVGATKNNIKQPVKKKIVKKAKATEEKIVRAVKKTTINKRKEVVETIAKINENKTIKKVSNKYFKFESIVIGIIILIILVLLGITAWNTMIRLNKENKYNNKASIVLKAALKWAEENQVAAPIHITVNQLISDRYVIPDEVNGDYYNPLVEYGLLNCNTIFINKNNGEYSVVFNKETDCELMQQELLGVELIAKVASGRDIKSGERVSSDIVLVIYSRLEIKNVTWYDNGEEIINYQGSKSYIVNPSISAYKTIRVLVETNRGNKEFRFIANIQKN